MSGLDPMTNQQLEQLAHKERDGKPLSKNQTFELDRAVRAGNKNVERIRHGR